MYKIMRSVVMYFCIIPVTLAEFFGHIDSYSFARWVYGGRWEKWRIKHRLTGLHEEIRYHAWFNISHVGFNRERFHFLNQVKHADKYNNEYAVFMLYRSLNKPLSNCIELCSVEEYNVRWFNKG